MKSVSFSLYIAIVFLFTGINSIIYSTPTPTPTPIGGDGNLCGQVTDAVTGKGINGTTVTVELTGQTGITGRVQGQDGVYCFPPLAEGEYIFTAEAEGYVPESKEVIITIGHPPDLNFALTPITTICEPTELDAEPEPLTLLREESATETVTLSLPDSSPCPNHLIFAEIKSGKKKIVVSPPSAITDENGQAIFTITATKKTGNAKVIFDAGYGLKDKVTVKVRRK